jgi:hypothetical protein
MSLPSWPPRDWRAFSALIASVLGAGILTVLAGWLVYVLWQGGWSAGTETARVEALATALHGTLAIIGIVLVGLGLAINRRMVKGSILGATFEATGGEDDDRRPADAS